MTRPDQALTEITLIGVRRRRAATFYFNLSKKGGFSRRGA